MTSDRSPDSRPGRSSGRYIGVALVAALIWGLVAVWGMPSLIRAGYAGTSAGFINDIFAGRNVHPVEFYLADWRALALQLTGLMALAAALVFLGIRYRAGRRRAIAWALGGEPALSLGRFIWLGLALGFTGGVLQAAFRVARQYVTQIPSTNFRPEVVWMAPISAALAGMALAMLVGGIGRWGGTTIGLRKAMVAFGFVAIYPMIQEDGISLYPWAEVLLSLGLAVALARLAAAHPDGAAHLLARARLPIVAVLVGLSAFAVWTLPDLAEGRSLARLPAPAAGRPNVLLVVLDTVRARSMSLYGYERRNTPQLESWAESSQTFDAAFSTAPWTLPAHSTMFTGRYHYETKTGPEAPLDGRFPTLAEALSAAGYATAGFVANIGYTSPTSGLARGFSRYQAQQLTWSHLWRGSWLSNALLEPIRQRTGLTMVERKNGRHVTAEFLGWLRRRNPDRPFFAFLNYFDAHSPYTPPAEFRTMFGAEPNEAWPAFDTRWHETPDHPDNRAQLPLWVNQYDGAIAYLDRLLGRIRDALAEQDLLDSTLVIITSDHGESWGDHGLIEHGDALFAPHLRVPLMLSLPGVVPAGRTATPVTIRDLPATVMAIAGVTTGTFPGTPLIAGPWTSGGAPSASTVLSELDREPWHLLHDLPIGRGDMKSIVEGDLHYILYGDGVEELYHLPTDPLEMRDVAATPEGQAALPSLRAALARAQAGEPAGR